MDAYDAGRRSRTVHGVSIGILMLDTGFERLPGDVGHAATWPFPVQYAVMRGADAAAAARGDTEGMLAALVAGARELVATGVDAIATSCGFLAPLQSRLAASCAVPVATSSLLQIPMVQQLLPAGRRVGILAATRAGLTCELFRAIGVPPDLPVEALDESSTLLRDHRENRLRVDGPAHRQEVAAAARRLLQRHPDVGAIVCECANFPRHSRALREATGLPIFDAVTLVHWLHASVSPACYD